MEGAKSEEGRGGKHRGKRMVKSNRGEGPEDKRMDRMWQWRDSQLQDGERCRRSSLLLISAVEEIVYVCGCVQVCVTQTRSIFYTVRNHNVR